ncbi:MAG: hypothetical protein GYB31_04780 [Bacteroidetes bacterium]|nr:hypothetical protein [Bacteroidota bacterium]
MKLRSRFIGNNKKKQESPDEDFGFSDKLTEEGQRLITADGDYNVLRKGLSAWTPYQDLVEMSWGRFFLLVVLFYISVNALLAVGYLLVGIDTLSGVNPGNLLHNFAATFFFSVQTFTTVGYGAVSPVGFTANILAALGALIGLMSFALATGLFFARFSKPKSALAFSDNAIIAPYRGIKGLMFRVANKRDTKMLDVVVRFSMTWIETENEKKSDATKG